MTQQELVDILEEHLLWIDSSGEEGKKADLSAKNLKRLNLRGADLSEADLRGVDLEGVDLEDCQVMPGTTSIGNMKITAYYECDKYWTVVSWQKK